MALILLNHLNIQRTWVPSGFTFSNSNFLQDFLIFQFLRLTDLVRSIKLLCIVVSTEITNNKFHLPVALTNFRSKTNKLSCSKTRVMVNFGLNFRWFCKNIKITVTTTNVSVLEDIEKTSQGIYTVNELTNLIIVGGSSLNGF